MGRGTMFGLISGVFESDFDCLTMCQWNLFLNPGVDIVQIGGRFNWQGGV